MLAPYDRANAMANKGYARLKGLIITLYYLSEIGSTVELTYTHAPGRWEPSIPVSPETRAHGGTAFM